MCDVPATACSSARLALKELPVPGKTLEFNVWSMTIFPPFRPNCKRIINLAPSPPAPVSVPQAKRERPVKWTNVSTLRCRACAGSLALIATILSSSTPSTTRWPGTASINMPKRFLTMSQKSSTVQRILNLNIVYIPGALTAGRCQVWDLSLRGQGGQLE